MYGEQVGKNTTVVLDWLQKYHVRLNSDFQYKICQVEAVSPKDTKMRLIDPI